MDPLRGQGSQSLYCFCYVASYRILQPVSDHRRDWKGTVDTVPTAARGTEFRAHGALGNVFDEGIRCNS